MSTRELISANCAVFDALRKNLRAGMSELDAKAVIDRTYRDYFGETIKYEYDLVSGKRSAKIDGKATGRTIKKGDSVIVDLSPYYDGFWADTARTFFIGAPDEVTVFAYETVLSAIKACEKIITTETSAGEIYTMASSVISGVSFGELAHHAGHVIGEKSPLGDVRFVAGNENKMLPGTVFTLEPGIYRKMGIRVENDYVLHRDGCENLRPYTAELSDFIIQA